jgi:hypothetical protein
VSRNAEWIELETKSWKNLNYSTCPCRGASKVVRLLALEFCLLPSMILSTGPYTHENRLNKYQDRNQFSLAPVLDCIPKFTARKSGAGSSSLVVSRPISPLSPRACRARVDTGLVCFKFSSSYPAPRSWGLLQEGHQRAVSSACGRSIESGAVLAATTAIMSASGAVEGLCQCPCPANLQSHLALSTFKRLIGWHISLRHSWTLTDSLPQSQARM